MPLEWKQVIAKPENATQDMVSEAGNSGQTIVPESVKVQFFARKRTETKYDTLVLVIFAVNNP